MFPDTFTQTALDAFKTRLKHFKGDEFIAYMGISDALAPVGGQAALIEFLKKVSDLLDTVRNDIGILLDVVLFSLLVQGVKGTARISKRQNRFL